MPPIQKHLVETMMTLPGATLEEGFRRRSAAINAVATYCKFQEGGAATQPRGRPPIARASPAKEGSPQFVAAEAEKQALNAVMLSVFRDQPYASFA